jgi:hypothetical protein
MKHAFRFLFGAALGIALGYALTLLVRPNHNGRPSRRPGSLLNKRDASR